MSDSSIGWATLSVIPGMTGFGAALSKGVEPQLAAAGAAGGSAFAKAFAPVAIVAAVAAVGVATTKMAADYQAATTLLVTGAGESVANIGMIRDGLLALAPAVGMGPEALAKAMFLVESAGFHGAAGLTVMNAAAQGAKVGGVDATLVADGLTTAMIDYHYAADQANTVTSKLVQTVALGKTNMGDLSSSLSNVLPFAANLKIGFNDIMGAMATMTSQGIDAARASTMLKFGIMALANETPAGSDALTAIGITTQQVVADLGTKGLSGTIAEITDAIGKKFPAGSALAVSALSNIFGGTRGIGMALALSGQNAETFTSNIASIAAAVPEADGAVKGWSLTQEDLNTQMDQARAFFSSVGIKIGTVLIPAVTRATQGFRDFAGEFEAGTGTGGKLRDILTAIHDDAIVPIATFLTGTAIPAVRSFVQGFKDGTGVGGGFKDFLILLYDDAVKPLVMFVTNTAVPIIKNFVQGFRDGAGPGGTFRDVLRKVYEDGIRPLATFITGTALPALKAIEVWITTKGGPAFLSFIGWVKENKGALEALAGIITVTMLPVFAVMAVDAVASGVAQIATWVATKVAAVESAVAQYGASVSIVSGWAISAAAAISSGAETVAIWALYKAEAISGAATSVASFAVTAGGWIATAATATASGIVMAAAWVIGLGPVAWIIAAVVAIGAAFVLAYNKVTWFRDGVDAAWAWIKSAASAVGDWFTKTVPEWWQSVLDGGSVLYNAGRAIITGFWNGLKSVWSDVTGWFSGIGDWIAAHKGPLSYDRQLLVPHGNAIMDGFNEGITAGFGRVKTNLTGISGDISSLMSAPNITSPDFPAGANGRPNGGSAQITQNVYPTPGMSEQQVGAYAASQLDWAMRGKLA